MILLVFACFCGWAANYRISRFLHFRCPPGKYCQKLAIIELYALFLLSNHRNTQCIQMTMRYLRCVCIPRGISKLLCVTTHRMSLHKFNFKCRWISLCLENDRQNDKMHVCCIPAGTHLKVIAKAPSKVLTAHWRPIRRTVTKLRKSKLLSSVMPFWLLTKHLSYDHLSHDVI